MTDPVVVLVHSPLVGPAAWRPVADQLTAAGRRAVVVDLSAAMTGAGPYQPRIARAVAGPVDAIGAPVVLVGHSGAGPLLPGIAAALREPPRGLAYVDAGLPYPGRSWFDTAPPDLAAQLRGQARDGWLPPWHQWFPADTLAGLLPDADQRAAFTDELGPLPLAYFREPMPPDEWLGPAGYLLLSEAYRQDATRAAEQGLPVLELASHHLGMVSSPVRVAAALADLLRMMA